MRILVNDSTRRTEPEALMTALAEHPDVDWERYERIGASQEQRL